MYPANVGDDIVVYFAVELSLRNSGERRGARVSSAVVLSSLDGFETDGWMSIESGLGRFAHAIARRRRNEPSVCWPRKSSAFGLFRSNQMLGGRIEGLPHRKMWVRTRAEKLVGAAATNQVAVHRPDATDFPFTATHRVESPQCDDSSKSKRAVAPPIRGVIAR